MGDTFITVVTIALAAVLLFVLPVVTMAERVDDVSQTNVQTITSEYVNDIKTTGKITADKYNSFIEEITATGNTFDVDMEVKILDENPGKKTTQATRDKIGENVYYSVYSSQIIGEKLAKGLDYDPLKTGDFVSVTVKNTNLTLGQQLKNIALILSGNDTYTIKANASGLVTANGK